MVESLTGRLRSIAHSEISASNRRDHSSASFRKTLYSGMPMRKLPMTLICSSSARSSASNDAWASRAGAGASMSRSGTSKSGTTSTDISGAAVWLKNCASKSASDKSKTSTASAGKAVESASDRASNSSSCFCRACISRSSELDASSAVARTRLGASCTPEMADRLSKSMPSMLSTSGSVIGMTGGTCAENAAAWGAASSKAKKSKLSSE